MTNFAYCERQNDLFWAEPLNAVSNLAFLMAALIAYWAWRRSTPGDGSVVALIGVTTLIGIGSFLFHTMPGPLTVLMDVVPIQLFVLGYFALVLRRFIGLTPYWTAIGLLGFIALNAVAALVLPRSSVSGSAAYVPALAALLVLGAFLNLRHHPAGPALLLGAALFAVSLAMRTLDQPFCASLPIGLHFAWHCFNGLLLGQLLLTAIRERSRNQHIKPAS